MRTSEQDRAVEAMRGIVARLILKLEPVCGSRMLAYEKVADAVGVSASWVRKFATIKDTPEPRWSVGCLLAQYYQDLCDSIDRRSDAERREIIKLVGGLNEANPLSDRDVLPDFMPHRSSNGRGDQQA